MGEGRRERVEEGRGEELVEREREVCLLSSNPLEYLTTSVASTLDVNRCSLPALTFRSQRALRRPRSVEHEAQDVNVGTCGL